MKAPDTIYIELITLVVNTAERLDSDVGYTRSDISYELAKTVEAQKAEIARLISCLAATNHPHLRIALVHERLQVALLRKELSHYGRHFGHCARVFDGSECTCGFTAALKGE